MRAISECAVTEIKARVWREEEGKEINFQHSDHEIVCEVISIEKCVFKNVIGGKRCDYLFLFDKNKQQYNYLRNKLSPAFYVELKGIGLADACEQLLNSIENTRDQIKNYDISALVVSSREFIPKYDNNQYYRDVKRIIRKNIQFEVTPHTVNF